MQTSSQQVAIWASFHFEWEGWDGYEVLSGSTRHDNNRSITTQQLMYRFISQETNVTCERWGSATPSDISGDASRSSVFTLHVCRAENLHARHGMGRDKNDTNYVCYRITQQDSSVKTHSLSHWLWSGGADVRGRQVAMEMRATVAFQEDGSWQNEAEHRLRQVK